MTKKRFPIPFDCYILKYPPGSSIPPHKDKTEGKHFRVNFVVTHPKGGEFQCDKPIFQSKWLNFFRPDISMHGVTTVESSRTRYVLSVGWIWSW